VMKLEGNVENGTVKDEPKCPVLIGQVTEEKSYLGQQGRMLHSICQQNQGEIIQIKFQVTA
jgi:hypothetical protein